MPLLLLLGLGIAVFVASHASGVPVNVLPGGPASLPLQAFTDSEVIDGTGQFIGRLGGPERDAADFTLSGFIRVIDKNGTPFELTNISRSGAAFVGTITSDPGRGGALAFTPANIQTLSKD